MSTLSQTIAARLDEAITVRLPAAALAFLLGSLLIWGVALGNSSTLHNAAHDGRHTFAIPCH